MYFLNGPKLNTVCHKVPSSDPAISVILYTRVSDLPKVIGRESVPMLFVDDTNIVFMHPNAIDFNINILSFFKFQIDALRQTYFL